MCIQIRSGITLWVERERATHLMQILTNGDTKFIEFDGQVFNRADIVGVFTAQTMEELKRRKNGEWQCSTGTWHGRNTDCECRRQEYKEINITEISYDEQQRNLKALDDMKKGLKL